MVAFGRVVERTYDPDTAAMTAAVRIALGLPRRSRNA